ncbi:MAG: hypothetical protein F4X63_00810 [Nitrospira sp. SB0662_bin_26]|nr:hypothetical protein [Nitrospira sp. SB0662_bin_26]
MPLDVEDGARALQLVTSRYDQREWRKKIEKILSLPPSGFEDAAQRNIFIYFKHQLQAYKSRRADPPSWIVGGYATKEVVDRARHRPTDINPDMTEADVSFLGVDPGADVDEVWWEDMLVKWFETPGEEFEETDEESDADSESESDEKSETASDEQAEDSESPPGSD